MDPIHVTKKQLQAVLAFASTDPTRAMLCAVAFEKGGRMIATDGHRLAVIDNGQPLEDGAGEPPVVLEAPALKAAAAAMGARDTGVLTLDPDPMPEGAPLPASRFATIETGSACHRIPIVEGDYPNWRQVAPKGSEPLAATEWWANPAYLADVFTTAKRLGVKALRVRCTGSLAPVLFEGGNSDTHTHFRGVVMPVRPPEA